MLILLVSHMVISICCLYSGILFYNLFQKKNESHSLLFYLISGLILLTGITQIITLFIPINWQVQLALMILLFFSVLITFKDLKAVGIIASEEIKKWSPYSLIIFFAIMVYNSPDQCRTNNDG